MEKYEDYLDKWLGGLESEIAFWKRYMETKGDIYYDTFKNQTEKDRHFTLERYLDGFSKTEQIKFIDIGSGPFSRCGHVTENYNLLVETVDPLAEVYNDLKKKNDLENGITIKTGFVELLDKYFDADSYDIVHMSNSFIIWRKNERYDIKKILDGYAKVEWNADVYEKKWKYNEVVITKLKECPIPENPYTDKMLERVYSFLLKTLVDKIGNCDNTIVLKNKEIIKEMKESQKLINNVLQISNDKKIDIYGMGVVGKNLIDILDNNNICINYIFDKDARKYKTYSSVQLENVKDIDKNIIFVAVMRDNKEIIEKLIKQGYKKDNVYLIENLV